MSDKIHGSLKIREPDSNLYVYDSDRDVVEPFDFAPSGRIPTSAFWDPKEPKLLVVETRKGSMSAPEEGNKTNIFSPGSKSPTRITSEDADSPEDEDGQKAEETKAETPEIPARVTQSTIQSNAEVRPPARAQKRASGSGAPATDARAGRNPRHPSLALQFVPPLTSSLALAQVEVSTMFVDSEYGIRLQQVMPLEPPMQMLLGISVPRLYFVQNESEVDDPDASLQEEKEGESKADGRSGPTLCSTVMRDFVGLADVDPQTLTALLDFSYYLTIGNMDAAYRAVKLIKNTTVWENMAHMCVKTKRLDVAEVCLGNMGYARGAAAVREAKKEPEPEAAIAMVAIQLGRIDDAAKLYEECGRYDLLNKLYQGQGQWDKAIEIATKSDRIHLKTTHHQYAKYLETIGDTAGAIRNFERADTYKTEVPRMLFDQTRIEDLEDYIMQGNDIELLKWWAGYCESLGHFEKARRYYARANDDLSLVRVACHNREMSQAADIVAETNSKSAAYHLARQYEAMGEVQEAISHFNMSGCYNHAIRLSKAYGLDSELMSFALKSRPSSMIDCAQYFEKKGEYEKAVQLYQKGGDNNKALDLCFRSGKDGKGGDTMFDVLKSLAENLGENASMVEVERCAEFFIENGQAAKAVEILWKQAKKYARAPHTHPTLLCLG
jgi:intraflagellar transport protein 140